MHAQATRAYLCRAARRRGIGNTWPRHLTPSRAQLEDVAGAPKQLHGALERLGLVPLHISGDGHYCLLRSAAAFQVAAALARGAAPAEDSAPLATRKPLLICSELAARVAAQLQLAERDSAQEKELQVTYKVSSDLQGPGIELRAVACLRVQSRGRAMSVTATGDGLGHAKTMSNPICLALSLADVTRSGAHQPARHRQRPRA